MHICVYVYVYREREGERERERSVYVYIIIYIIYIITYIYGGPPTTKKKKTNQLTQLQKHGIRTSFSVIPPSPFSSKAFAARVSKSGRDGNNYGNIKFELRTFPQ